jgi:hypothetical protein
VICKSGFHRWRDSQRLVDAEIVIPMIDRNHVAVVLKLFGERICEPSEMPDAYTEIQILPLDEAS